MSGPTEKELDLKIPRDSEMFQEVVDALHKALDAVTGNFIFEADREMSEARKAKLYEVVHALLGDDIGFAEYC
jgi:hypothetical protein